MKNHDVSVHDQMYNLIETGFSTTIVCEIDRSNPISTSDNLTLKEYVAGGPTGRQISVRVVNIDEQAHGVKDGFCLVTFFFRPLIQQVQYELIDRLNDPNEDENEMCLDACLDIVRLFLNQGLLPKIMETCADYAEAVNKENNRSEAMILNPAPLEGVLTQCAEYVNEKDYNIPVYNILDIDDED